MLYSAILPKGQDRAPGRYVRFNNLAHGGTLMVLLRGSLESFNHDFYQSDQKYNVNFDILLPSRHPLHWS